MREREEFQKIESFKILQELLINAKTGSMSPEEALRQSLATLEQLGNSPDDAFKLYTNFILGEVSSTMQGGYTQLPELGSLPKGSWERKRVASFTWWYAQFRINEEFTGRIDHAFKRAWLDLGNNDGESLELLRWADKNPGIIAANFAEAIVDGELSTFHIPTLSTFITKSVEGTLKELELPDDLNTAGDS